MKNVFNFNDLGSLPDGMDEPSISINKVEVFRCGDYGAKGSFNEGDLDGIVSRYQGSSAPVTLEHVQSGPAFGWVSRIYREGQGLFADLVDVPVSFAKALKAKRYAKRSIELVSRAGMKCFRALTFLGAASPRVQGMKDIVFAFEAEEEAEE